MRDWRIRKKEEGCAACERTFEEGESLFSVLLVEPDTLGREDRCASCFESEDVSPEGVFWRTRFRPGKKRLAVDFEGIERLFLALEGREDERLCELRYLLALLLMRKKRLKLVRVRRAEGEELLLMRRPRRTEELSVRVFDLPAERLALLRADLERIVEGAGAEELAAPPAVGEGAAEEVPGAPEAAPEGEAPPEPGAQPVPPAPGRSSG